jgi:hypothetical protein
MHKEVIHDASSTFLRSQFVTTSFQVQYMHNPGSGQRKISLIVEKSESGFANGCGVTEELLVKNTNNGDES